MGGKGGGGYNNRMPLSQPATGGRNNQPQRGQQQSRSASARFQSRPLLARSTRIPDNELVNLYAPPAKSSPQAPPPARIGVRAERQAYNPQLAIPQKDIDQLYGYGPTFAIPEKDIQGLYGGRGDGGMGSLLDEGEDYDSITGEIF
jgi:hypothetical protein